MPFLYKGITGLTLLPVCMAVYWTATCGLFKNTLGRGPRVVAEFLFVSEGWNFRSLVSTFIFRIRVIIYILEDYGYLKQLLFVWVNACSIIAYLFSSEWEMPTTLNCCLSAFNERAASSCSVVFPFSSVLISCTLKSTKGYCREKAFWPSYYSMLTLVTRK